MKKKLQCLFFSKTSKKNSEYNENGITALDKWT